MMMMTGGGTAMTLSGASAAKAAARSRKAKIWPRCGGLWSSTCNKHYFI